MVGRRWLSVAGSTFIAWRKSNSDSHREEWHIKMAADGIPELTPAFTWLTSHAMRHPGAAQFGKKTLVAVGAEASAGSHVPSLRVPCSFRTGPSAPC